MKNYKTLNIRGTVLDKHQLETYLEKIASEHLLKNNSDKETYPIPILKNNFEFIKKVYNLLNDNIKQGINIHPAGEWLLDNFYIIEETAKIIEKELTLKKYTNLISIANEPYKGFARIYVLAAEMVAYTDNKIDSKNLKFLISSYQNKKTLSMEEIWSIQNFLQIALIQNIKEICESIYISQIQKSKVNNIIERLIEKKHTVKQRFTLAEKYKQKEMLFTEMKYPFIEYMSYRLKKYGKESYGYLNILEEQVNKMGTTIDEVIKKEHFAIAKRKVSIGNAINSIKDISRINFQDIFEEINGVEEILKKDPANIYEKMNYKTKEYYRSKIQELSTKSKISEIYIITKALELAKKHVNSNSIIEKKKSHIGYYLISDGISELVEQLQYKNKKEMTKIERTKIYINMLLLASVILAIIVEVVVFISTKNIWISILSGILSIIPLSEIYIQIENYILGKTVKPKLIPKINLYSGVPEEYATFVVIPTIVNSKEKVRSLIKKLEVYYLANKSENIYFAILGDCTSGKNELEPFDEEVELAGYEEIKKLNNKYKDNKFPKFHFLYRKRKWNSSEGMYLGWERKRGLLCQFNNYLLNKDNADFIVNTIEMYKENNLNIPKIKYIITLDSDTNLVLESGLELIGAMAHILNTPIVKNGVVVDGYGIIQPRVGIDLVSSRKSLFTEIYAETGGTDLYSNAISDIYQDNFEEGIFTGKGIYDLEVFHKILSEEIPENTVLSHDLLEGSYLKCGLATDILLMDGYPAKYNSYISRFHRWTRGDWQILKWLNNKIKNKKGEIKENPLNKLSRFKIFDNLRRSLVPICALLLLVFSFKQPLLITIAIVTILMPMILDLLNYIVFKNDSVQKQKNFTKTFSSLQTSVIKGILELGFLPYKSYVTLDAIIKTLYRMRVKKNLLEWMTAEEAERNSKTDLLSYYLKMYVNIIFAVIFFFSNNVLGYILALLWLISPYIAWYISREKTAKKQIDTISENDKKYLLDIANKTWGYFDKYITKENNYLPPDNYQDGKVVNRTSSTNIGLGLLAIVSAYDLKFIDYDKLINIIENMLQTITRLAKWNGHLYNWYNIKTLEPLYPRYISSVDSGNFIGYLYVLKQFLEQNIKTEKEIVLINIIEEIIKNTDFSYLYNQENRLFSVGYNIEEGKLTDSYYDFLASEARQTSLIAIAKKDIPLKHWSNLSRTLTVLNRYKGLISWSGTAFEYLMPNVNITKYNGSLLDESCKFLIMSQKEYSKKYGIPWGISESAYNIKDLNGSYQYKAFGIPWLGLKRGLGDELVVAPYASILALPECANDVISNLKTLEKHGMLDQYGFYESIDFTPSRLKYNQKYAVVKTYMAHHQGLILLSINNLINDNILPKRFSANPQIEAVDILLQERMPRDIIITKEQKEKVEKLKYTDYEDYSERVFNKINEHLENTNIISNENYTIAINDKGIGFSKYKNLLVNRYKKTADTNQGMFFYIKNVKNKKIWSSFLISGTAKPDKYTISFSSDANKIKRVDSNIETTTTITVAPEESIEIRRLKLKNIGNLEELLEVTSFFEPVLLNDKDDYSHPVFNNLFLKYEYNNENIIIERKKRGNIQRAFLGTSLYTESDTIGELEYEIDKEKFIGRNNIGIPEMIEESKPFTKQIGLVVEPIVAMKKIIKIQPGETITLDLIICVSENKKEVIDLLNKCKNSEEITRIFELSKARTEAENRYLGLKHEDIYNYQKLLSYLIFKNPFKKLYINEMPKKTYEQKQLWQYGISGDNPILLLKIKNINDIEVVEDILKAYEYFNIKNIKIDLVILNEEENKYEKYLLEGIENAILNKHLAYLKNNGIYVLNLYEIKDKDILEFRSDLIINAHFGNLTVILKELEDEYLDSIKNIGNDDIETKMLETDITVNENEQINNLEDVKYYNEYGAFSEDGKEYLIKTNAKNRTPTVWSHVMANENFGTLVTESMGGFTWSKNSRLNRISAWNNEPSIDVPSEIIYIRDNDTNKIWTLGSGVKPDENDYYITYGFGYAKYSHNSNGILQELDIFVPRKDSVKVNILKLKNTTPDRKNLKLIYYVKPVLAEDEIKSDTYIDIQYMQNSNCICAKNLYGGNGIVYICSSEKIKSYTGSKKTFIGNGTLQNPDGINKISLGNENSLGQNACIAIELNIAIESYENKEISLIIGEEENILDVQNISYKYGDIKNCVKELQDIKKYWYNLLNKVQVKTPLESANIILNGWAIYQTIVCRLWARSGYYQSGGAYGFRDQLQDTLGLKYISPEFMKEQIIRASKHQFIAGDVEHWWHDDISAGIRTRFSDDLLWLPYVVAEYINFTDDYSILEIQTPYLSGEELKDGIDEKYDVFVESDLIENIYSHCIKSIEKSLNFGELGLPKIGSGDWNDGFSTVGNKGKGQSVWLGFFLYDILNKFIPICEYKNDIEKKQKYEEIKEKLRKSLNVNGWDGRWFRRAYTDENDVLGSIENEECKIDSIAQSWSIISKAGDNDKKYISLESLENHLIDTENGIIKLLDPPFENGKLEPGYIKSYLPGIRENGGQYTHAAAWVIIAESILGFNEKALEYFRLINPIEHSRTKDSAKKYKVEPYVLPGDVYGAGNLNGRGGWTWYTGSSSWYYKAGIEYILGLQIEKNILKIKPCIPREWKEYSIRYIYGTSIYNIRIKNISKSNEVQKLILNGQEIEEKQIKLIDEERVNNIEIEL